VRAHGVWYLYATCDVPEPEVYEPDGFLGVDLGIANIATTGDGTVHAGRHLNQVRHRNRRLRPTPGQGHQVRQATTAQALRP
jgi:Transposase and inactivated derivatives